jgi:hypothetical protein
MEPKAKLYQVLISAELRTQGLRLLEHLISKHLIFGGPVLNGPARFLWKNEIVEHDYCWIVTFTREDLKDELIREAEKRVGGSDLHDLLHALRRQSGVACAAGRGVQGARDRPEAEVQGRRRRADFRRVERHPEADDQFLGRSEPGAARRPDPLRPVMETSP